MAAAHRVVMDTLCVRLGLIRGLTLLSRHHSPSLSIVVVLAGHTVAMVTYYVAKMITTCSPMGGQFFDTMHVISSN